MLRRILPLLALLLVLLLNAGPVHAAELKLTSIRLDPRGQDDAGAQPDFQHRWGKLFVLMGK